MHTHACTRGSYSYYLVIISGRSSSHSSQLFISLLMLCVVWCVILALCAAEGKERVWGNTLTL